MNQIYLIVPGNLELLNNEEFITVIMEIKFIY